MTELIERELQLPYNPDEVWTALTDTHWLESWLAETVELDAHPGGDARFVVDGEARDGWVEEVTPPVAGDGSGRPGRLTFWWQAPDASPSRVSIEVIATDQGTLMRVVEARPMDVLDLVGLPLPGGSSFGERRFGPALVAG